MKLEETDNLKLQYVNKIRTIMSQEINDSDTELAEKVTQILNIYEKKNLKASHRSKNGVISAVDTDIA